MQETTHTKIRWTFWVIAVLALIWYLMSGLNFFVQMNPEMLAKAQESHRALIEGRPPWATLGFAVAAIAGILGCVALLVRRSIAIRLFVISFVGVLVTTVHNVMVVFGGKGAGTTFTGSDILMMVVSPVLVALLLIFFAIRSRTRGWIS